MFGLIEFHVYSQEKVEIWWVNENQMRKSGITVKFKGISLRFSDFFENKSRIFLDFISFFPFPSCIFSHIGVFRTLTRKSGILMGKGGNYMRNVEFSMKFEGISLRIFFLSKRKCVLLTIKQWNLIKVWKFSKILNTFDPSTKKFFENLVKILTPPKKKSNEK